MVVYLHYAHAIGMERLVMLMEELFSLSISEGAISNILARARGPLLVASAARAARDIVFFIGSVWLDSVESGFSWRGLG